MSAQRLQLSRVTPTATSARVCPRMREADWPPYDAPYFMNGDGASVVVLRPLTRSAKGVTPAGESVALQEVYSFNQYIIS